MATHTIERGSPYPQSRTSEVTHFTAEQVRKIRAWIAAGLLALTVTGAAVLNSAEQEQYSSPKAVPTAPAPDVVQSTPLQLP